MRGSCLVLPGWWNVTTPVAPYLSSSVYENPSTLQIHGPAPGIRLIEEMPDGRFIWRPFSFYGLAGDDAAWANFAFSIMTSKYPFGTELKAISGLFNLQTLVTVPQNPAPHSLRGVGRSNTIMQPTTAAGGIYMHRTIGYGAQFGQTDQQELGHLTGIKVDGTNAPLNCIGLDIGDGWGLDVDVAVANFTATQNYSSSNGTITPATAVPPVNFPIFFLGTAPPGFTLGIPYYVFSNTSTTFTLVLVPGVGPAINTAGSANGSITGNLGFHHCNQVFWAEKQTIRAELRHNSVAALIDTLVPTHDHSKEYNVWRFSIFCDSNQDGIVFATGVNLGGSELHIQGNMAHTSSNTAGQPTNNVAALKFVSNDSVADNSRLYFADLHMKVEGNPGNGTGSVYPFSIWSDGQGYIRDAQGRFTHSLTPNNLVAAGVEFSIRGSNVDNSNLITVTTPAMPATGTAVENEFPYDCLVYSTGGTGVSYTIAATVVPALTSGFIGLVPSGGSITPNYTTAPAWTWVPAGVLIAA
jgi:hypothetical protein